FKKGASISFTGSKEFRRGFFYRRTLRKHHEYGLIKIWLTPHLMDLDQPSHQRFLKYRERTFSLFRPEPNNL
ncbi:MAG: hypothetical protein ACO3DK_03585, partial [Bacteroidia bacterium]